MPTATSSIGGQIHYQVSSLIPPWSESKGTIFMHHGVALTGDAWCEWQPALLAAGYRIIRIDMRGFGRSEPVAEGHQWSMQDFFADIDAVLEAESIDKFHYVGESLGGMIGLAYAARRPTRILSCALLSTPFDGSRIKAVDRWRGLIESQGMTAWSTSLMPMRFAENDVAPAKYEWVHKLQSRCSPTACYGQAEFIKTQDLSAELSNIEAPVLILAPDGSPFVDRSMAYDLHQHLKASEIQWFPGQRHSLLMSRPDGCARAYASFLQRRT
ncbi:MAG: alpha/beta hydrolase [Xanthobacteraceae bacterium]